MIRGRRGQASWGVMEVLIATIILGMSMGIVFFALRNIEDTRCVASLKASTVSLQNAMLDVALGSPPTQRRVVFTMPQCGDKSVEALRFVYYKKRELCRLCPGQYSGCWIIEPTVYDAKLRKLYTLVDAATCVNMPADIGIVSVPSSDDPTCLGNQMTCTPCPEQSPDGSRLICMPGVHNVPATVYAASSSCTSANPASQSLWSTFGRKRGDPRTFIFELSKAVGPSAAGIIKVCPKKAGG